MEQGESKQIQNKTYTNLKEISFSGSFGKVYEAKCEGKIYAIKEFKIDSDAKLKSFIVELGFVQKMAGEFNDDSPIIKIFGYECIEKTLYYVMELGHDSLENYCQQNLVNKDDSDRLRFIQIIYSYILKALLFLKQKKIVHRDIKPDNFLVFNDSSNEWGFNIKIIDFGTIRILDENSVTNTTSIGSFAYMAPESFSNKLSSNSDIWSLGIILFKLLNKNAFPNYATSPEEIMKFALSKDEVEFPILSPIYSELWDITKKCLVKKYEDRMDALELCEYTRNNYDFDNFESIISPSKLNFVFF